MSFPRMFGLLLPLLPLAACQDSSTTCGLRLCDIRAAACQQMAAQAAACLRGGAVPATPVRVVTMAAYQNEESSVVPTAAEDHAFHVWHTGLAHWGLAPASLTYAQAAQISASSVAAEYAPDKKLITIVDGGDALDSRWAVQTLVHEYVHAMQDAQVDLVALAAVQETDFDRTLATEAMVEGEATVLGDQAEVLLFGDSVATTSFASIYGNYKRYANGSVVASTMPVDLAWVYFHYPYGAAYQQAVYAKGGVLAMAPLLSAPPSGSREVMAGYGVAEPTGAPFTESLGAEAVAILPDRFAYVDSDTYGGWLATVFFARNDLNAWTNLPNVVGDHFSVYEESATGQVVSVWRLRFTTAALATTAAADLGVDLATKNPTEFASGTTQYRFEQRDRDLILVAAPVAELLAAIPAELAFAAKPTKIDVHPTTVHAIRCPRRLSSNQ